MAHQIELKTKEQTTAICINTEYYMKLVGLEWEDLVSKVGIRRETIRSWLNGTREPGLDKVSQIATFLKESGCNLLLTPKQLLADSPFALSKSDLARNNISYLMNKYFLTPQDLIDIGLSKNTAYLLYGNRVQPTYKMLLIILRYFQKKGIPVKSALDLIYFPSWGEKPETFLTYRNIV